ncbi:hypothetical protein [Nocardiopsis ganjiahuensis]|uniref:hypothetical protein n=1 Tax=Nocardiopsis ganjiahuensis TaxID=239984 RepID=UPI000344CCF3|nr:hypothetical protein [Nocardiopsis ganjiahuensis]
MRSVRSTTRPLAALAAAAVATLAVAAAPGTAHAAEDDRISCVATPSPIVIFPGIDYTCETQTPDISWYVTGRCLSYFHDGGFPARSATVEGSGTTTISCPTVGPAVYGPVDTEVVVL